VTVIYRDFRSDERAIEAPLFTGQAKHGSNLIGIKISSSSSNRSKTAFAWRERTRTKACR
jgi:hypothetical protein